MLQKRTVRHELIDAICLVSRGLDDRNFDAALARIRDTRGVNSEAKTLLTVFLVSKGHAEVIRDFDKSFNSICKRFLTGKIDESQLLVAVQQACLLRRRNLHTVIGEMLSHLQAMGDERPYIHVTQREKVEVLYQGLRIGLTALREIASSSSATLSQGEAAIYGLGCVRRPDLFNLFSTQYDRRSRGHDFPIRRECVDAIVYSCTSRDILDFLTASLEKERLADKGSGFRWIRRKQRRADVMRLILGATYCPEMNVGLESELRYWLTSNNMTLAAYAVLALERHGAIVNGLNEQIVKEVEEERSFRDSHFSYSELLQLRGIYFGD
jgi:hypothetical protein